MDWAILVVGVANAALLVALLTRRGDRGAAQMQQSIQQSLQQAQLALQQSTSEALRAGREEAALAARQQREEIAAGFAKSNETLAATLHGVTELERVQLEGMTRQVKELQDGVAKQMNDAAESNRKAIDGVRLQLDGRVKELQESNEKKLEEMRKTVDEKLQGTLEKRLGESFKLVGERLDAVHKGLGEMQNLATGVGDLKRVLTNVKARGTWAEVQLGTILEQVLAPGQYEKNVRPRADSLEVVEYAIRLPGPKHDPRAQVWLPIDSKFPLEDYDRLQRAAESGDADGVAQAADALARRVRDQANDVNSKYVSPPATTDFAIMYLATEGLYAEVIRNPALADELHHRHRVVVAGPTTLAAILNALRMGFQTLAIEQRASEVWDVLAAVKTEFGNFGSVLSRLKKQLDTASRTVDATGVRTRAMERKLREVEQLPSEEANDLLGLDEPALDDDDEPLQASEATAG